MPSPSGAAAPPLATANGSDAPCAGRRVLAGARRGRLAMPPKPGMPPIMPGMPPRSRRRRGSCRPCRRRRGRACPPPLAPPRASLPSAPPIMPPEKGPSCPCRSPAAIAPWSWPWSRGRRPPRRSGRAPETRRSARRDAGVCRAVGSSPASPASQAASRASESEERVSMARPARSGTGFRSRSGDPFWEKNRTPNCGAPAKAGGAARPSPPPPRRPADGFAGLAGGTLAPELLRPSDSPPGAPVPTGALAHAAGRRLALGGCAALPDALDWRLSGLPTQQVSFRAAVALRLVPAFASSRRARRRVSMQRRPPRRVAAGPARLRGARRGLVQRRQRRLPRCSETGLTDSSCLPLRGMDPQLGRVACAERMCKVWPLRRVLVAVQPTLAVRVAEAARCSASSDATEIAERGPSRAPYRAAPTCSSATRAA